MSHRSAAGAVELGLDGVTHFYGHFESLLKDGALPYYPEDYNYFDEQSRFGWVARLAPQAAFAAAWPRATPSAPPAWSGRRRTRPSCSRPRRLAAKTLVEGSQTSPGATWSTPRFEKTKCSGLAFDFGHTTRS